MLCYVIGASVDTVGIIKSYTKHPVKSGVTHWWSQPGVGHLSLGVRAQPGQHSKTQTQNSLGTEYGLLSSSYE